MNNSDPKRRSCSLTPAIVFAVALVGVALLVRHTVKETRNTRVILTKGYAEKLITSDWAIWSVEIGARFPQIAPAYAKIENDLKLVSNYLNANGVPAEAAEISSVLSQTIYKKTDKGNNTNEIEFYELSQRITVSSKDPRQIEKVSRGISSLLKEGVELSSSSPSYFYSHISDLKIEMLGEAAKEGRVKAEKIAGNCGASVGRLVSAQQGVFQITPVHSFDISDQGTFDTSSIEKMIRAIVTAKYTVE